jgi:hypothetical protein
MVAVNKILFAGALAATVSAVPVAVPITYLSAEIKAISQNLATVDGKNIEKRAIGDNASNLNILLNQVSCFINETIFNLLKLDLGSEAETVSKLLSNLSDFLGKLEQSFKNHQPGTGFGNLSQTL